jgi:ribonuclease HI
MSRNLAIYTDGAARGNPGPSASGYLIYEGRKVLHKHSEYNGEATNNYAEYRAVIMALRWCISNLGDMKELRVDMYSDSELVIRQINGEYKIRAANLRPLNAELKEMAKGFKTVKFRNVRREDENIRAVDRALNALLDRKEKADASKNL